MLVSAVVTYHIEEHGGIGDWFACLYCECEGFESIYLDSKVIVFYEVQAIKSIPSDAHDHS